MFSAILTEYTDWSSVTRHPITTRDTTLEALSDGLYVAPAIETADYHASLNKNSWFYMFDFQSKFARTYFEILRLSVYYLKVRN